MKHTTQIILMSAAAMFVLAGCNDRTGYDASISTTVPIDEDRALPVEFQEEAVRITDFTDNTDNEDQVEQITEGTDAASSETSEEAGVEEVEPTPESPE